jgi:putative aldouronate transport system substrate-binding protein
MDAPLTIDEYHDVLTAFKTEEGTRSALWLNYRGNTVGGLFGNAFDVDTYYGPTQGYNMFYQIDGTVHWTPLEDGFRQYLETMAQWYSEGLIYPDFCAEVGDELIPDPSVWAQEQLGVCFAPNGLIPVAGMWSGEGANYTGAYAPHLTADQTTHFLVGTQYVVSGHGLYMTANCENPELFCEWANWLYTEDGQFFKNYGVEGESFEYDENGEPQLKYSAIYEDFEGVTNATLQYYLGGDSLWTINNSNIRNIDLPEEQVVAYERWVYQNDIEYNMPYGVTLTTDESIKFGQIFSDLSTYVEEFWPAAIMGQKSLDDASWNDFISTLNSLGAQDCVDMWQDALDRYNG